VEWPIVYRLRETKGPSLRVLDLHGPYAVAVHDNLKRAWVDWEVTSAHRLPHVLREFERTYDIYGGRYTFYLITMNRLDPDEVRRLERGESLTEEGRRLIEKVLRR